MLLITQFENQFLEYIQTEMDQDLAHDINHVLRVVKTAKFLCRKERALEEIVVPAAYLHDCFSFSKNHPNRSQSSKVAADKAVKFLDSIAYPIEYLGAIHHAILAHSYSARVEPETLEAKIVQDADRLDALGATGIARCIQVSSKLGRPLYSSDDPFCSNRLPDDSLYTIDHFYTKLLSLSGTMNTITAKKEAELRTAFMHEYLRQMEVEMDGC
ncbi:HD domain-containing protein [Psychromonas sp.]|uniref:HD domain-containing protein n=1 Tax=Psychromonas sp. TaxID=1884585 RepID=UPI00356A09DF